MNALIYSVAATEERLNVCVIALAFMSSLLPTNFARAADAPVSDSGRQTIVILGDSLAAGYGLDLSERKRDG